MNDRKNFSELLADEEFQSGVIHFDSFDNTKKKAFIKRFAVTKEEFIRARTILDGLSFKGIDFSDEELNYLWEKLGIESSVTTHSPKPQTGRIISWFSKVAALFFIPLLIVSIWFFERTLELESFKREKVDQLTRTYNTVSAPAGGKTKAVLPDGSEVWLNAGSAIRYPLLSKPEYREVELTGEGFFKVIKNPDKPMLVTTSGMLVKVYGTTFNVSAYEDDADIEAVLVEGKISIMKLNESGVPVDTALNMKPGELGRLDKQEKTLAVTRANNMDIYTGWVKGKYVFRNTRFDDILRRLERLHNVGFVLEDKTLGDYKFDATFEDQNIDRIMEIFVVSLPIKWRSVKAEPSNDRTFSTRQIVISRDQLKDLQ